MYPDDARSYDAGDDVSSLDASEIPNFFNTMVPTVVTIYNVVGPDNFLFAAGVVISPYGHILTPKVETDTNTNRSGMKVYFKDDNEGFKAAICYDYGDYPFLLLKLESERDDFPYARLSTSAPKHGGEIHFIHPNNSGFFGYLKGMISCPSRDLSSLTGIKLRGYPTLREIIPTNIWCAFTPRIPITLVEVGAIPDSDHICGTPFFSKNGTVIGIYYFTAFNLSYGFNLDYLRIISSDWEEKITECLRAKRTKLNDGSASSSQSVGGGGNDDHIGSDHHQTAITTLDLA